MAYTADQAQALRDAIASGVLTVRSSTGETVTYRSLAEMRSLLSEMEADIAGADPNAPRRATHINPIFSRGV